MASAGRVVLVCPVLTNRWIPRSPFIGSSVTLPEDHERHWPSERPGARVAIHGFYRALTRLLGLWWLWWSVLFRSSTGHGVLGSKTAENDYYYGHAKPKTLTLLTVSNMSSLVPPAKVVKQAVGRYRLVGPCGST